MKCGNFKYYSETNKSPVDPMMHFKARMRRVDIALKALKEMNPEDMTRFIAQLKDNFVEDTDGYHIDKQLFDWKAIREKLEILPNFPELETSVFLYICKTLKVPQNYTPDQGEIELLYYDRIKAVESLTYHIVKTFTDVYGREEGIEIYKEIVPFFIRDMKQENPEDLPEDPKTKTVHKMVEGAIESWRVHGLADFSYCILDDYRVIYRFDKCLIPEVLREYNDPDLAYLASCYIGDNPEWTKDRVIHMRRTQTLQHSEFCDELYWNNLAHPDAEQPDLEFTKNIGKEV
jgi:hypothetical protein